MVDIVYDARQPTTVCAMHKIHWSVAVSLSATLQWIVFTTQTDNG